MGEKVEDIDALSCGSNKRNALGIEGRTCGAETIDEPDLEAPHPRMAERAFVLAPLAEIAPDLRIADQALVDC